MNRKIPAAFEKRLMTAVRRRYADFGPTLATEHLAQDGLGISRETLRNGHSGRIVGCSEVGQKRASR